MIDVLPESQGNLLAVRLSGKVTAEDYEQVFIPELELLIKEYGRIRALVQLDEGFEGWELGAMWDDARFGMQHRHDFERLAIVGGQRWVEWGTRVGAMLMDGELENFPAGQYQAALDWLNNR